MRRRALFFGAIVKMEWSSDFSSVDDVTVYLIANLHTPSAQDKEDINIEELKGRVLLCYGSPGKLHCIAHFAGAFHFWIGSTLYASQKTLAILILDVAMAYMRDFL